MANIPTQITIQLTEEKFGSAEKRYFIEYKDNITNIQAPSQLIKKYSELTASEKSIIDNIELQAKGFLS